MATLLKKCSICKNSKDLFSFHKDKSTTSGYKTACKECTNVKRKNRYNENPYDKQYKALPEVKEKEKQYAKNYRNVNSEKVKKSIAEWSRNNKDKRLATVLKYKYSKQKATASWDSELTEFVTEEAANLCKIREQVTGFKWHIDHVIPLQGKNVCGLHVWNNLQLLPAKINQSKGNRYEHSSC
jgi:hypothetical protein